MLSKLLTASDLSVPATATSAVSTAVDLSTDPQRFPFAEGTPAVVAIEAIAAHGSSTTTSTVAVETSVDGGTTYKTAVDAYGVAASVTLPIAAASRTYYVNVANLGERVRIKAKSSATGGGGTVSAYALSN